MEPEIYPLEADGIRKNFGNLCLLRDIYVKVEPCAVTALLGRNGVGKSTLMKIIYGIERSDGVSVRHGGKNVDRPYKRTGLIRYLPQHPFLPENIKLIRLLKLYGTTVDRLAPFISDLNDRLHKTLGELSVGQKRMLETVLVLTSPVKFVFLDEPFLGLAPLHIECMKQLIVSEAAHKGILISDHSYKHVLEISDFCYLLRSDGVLSPVKDIPGDLKKWGYIP
ncbi:MAG: ATP-binding cassette domain-containing protein [Spirosomataceae bacterium]